MPCPLDWSKRGRIGDWYMPRHITYPLIMAFNVQENAVFMNEFSKHLPTVAPFPRSVASLPRFGPPLTNPG